MCKFVKFVDTFINESSLDVNSNVTYICEIKARFQIKKKKNSA